MPTCFELGLENVEHSTVVAGDVAELADPLQQSTSIKLEESIQSTLHNKELA